MISQEQIREAIAAQEGLRGVVPDEVVDAAIGALQSQLADEDVAEIEDRRRQATVMFADVAGFTALSEGLDPEVVADLMNELWLILDAAIEDAGGRVDKHIGDAVMGVWGVDSSREDDPERAVRGALALRQGFEEFRVEKQLPINIRIGVNTGPVLFGHIGSGGETSVTGDAVNVASRLEHAAPLGEILISYGTYRQVRGVFDLRELEPVLVKGKSKPLRCYVVTREKERAFRLPTRGVEGRETSFVGRELELEALTAAYQRAVDTECVQRVVVIGDAGAGKSRMLQEFTEWLDLRAESIYYFKGRCLPDLTAVPLGLIRELLGFRFEIYDDDTPEVVMGKLRGGLAVLSQAEADIVGQWIGFDLSASAAVAKLAGSPEFGSAASAHLTRYFRHLLEDSPVVLVLEDAHWADPESLAVVNHLNEQLEGRPLLVLLLARPGFLVSRPEWSTESAPEAIVHLDDLSDHHTRMLASDILQDSAEVPEALIDLIVDRADGNPFYVEELIKMMIDDGVLLRSNAEGPWRVSPGRLDELTVPPTLEGVLQSRLDALRPSRRKALQQASVIGRTFWDAAVISLHDGSSSDPDVTVRESLDELHQRELVRRSPESVVVDSTEFVFKHALLRDATYETVLLRDRRRLHALAARWLEEQAGQRIDEYLGLIAEHLEKANDADRAAEFHERAGAKSLSIGSLGAARLAYERALKLREVAGTDHGLAATQARLGLASVLEHSGALELATTEYETAEADAGESDTEVVVLARTGRARVAALQGDWPTATALIGDTEQLAESQGGTALVRHLDAHAWTLVRTGQTANAHLLAERGLALSRELDDPALELDVLNTLASTYAVTGDHETASVIAREGLRLARDVGNMERESMLMANLAAIAHMGAGNGDDHKLKEAIGLYRDTYHLQEELGASGAIMTLANLAQALVEAGQLDEGAEQAHRALRRSSIRQLAAERGIATIVHAQLEIARGDVDRGLAILGAIKANERSYDMRADGEFARCSPSTTSIPKQRRPR